MSVNPGFAPATGTGGTSAVYIDSTAGTLGVRVGQVDGTVAVYFSPSSPAVSATFSAASIEVVPTTGSRKTMDDAHAAQRVLIVGSQPSASLQITGITNTIGAHITGTAGTLGVRVGQIDGSVAVYFSPANPSVNATFAAASLEVVQSTGSRKATDDAHAAVRVLIAGSQTAASLQIVGITNSIAVHLLSTNGTIATNVQRIYESVAVHILSTNGTMGVNVQRINETVAVHLNTTAGTLAVNVGKISDTIAVYLHATAGTVNVALKPGAILVNKESTASLFVASGSASGVSVSGNTIISPSANASFKVFAYSIQTTAQVSLVCLFTNGAGTSPTEFGRPLITASGVTGAQGANLSTGGPGNPLFATGVSTTLALKLDSASLVHYTVWYTKESA